MADRRRRIREGCSRVAIMNKRSVFILAGQSNMSRRGGVKDRCWDGVIPPLCHPHPSILRFSAAGAWEPASEPLHSDIDYSKPCGVSSGIPFAHALLSFSPPNAEIGLVPCAEGGSTLTDWACGSRLYNQLVRRTKESIYGGGCEIKAMIWFHGESDALSEEATAAYGIKMKKFIGDLRCELSLPSLSFIQIASWGYEGLVEKVREAQLGLDLTGVICVDSMGLPLNDDGIHLTTQGQIELGRMLAEAYVDNFLQPTQQ